MVDKKHIHLMNRELDGANSADDSRNLKDYLARNEDARTYLDGLRRSLDMMRQAERGIPVSDLKGTILTAIREDESASAERKAPVQLRPGPFRKAVGFSRPKLVYGVFFAMGLVFGIVLLLVFNGSKTGSGLNEQAVVGTLLNLKSPTPGETSRIDRDGVTQDLSVQSSGDLVLIKVRGDSAADIEMVFSYDGSKTRFAAFERLGGENCRAGLEAGRLAVHALGAYDYLIVFERSQETEVPLNYKILAAGSLFYEKDIVGPKGGNR